MPVAALLRGPTISTHAPRIEVVRYSASLKGPWDAFMSKAKNSTFLFQRDYMDYHAQRFSDYSLMLYSGSHVAAVLPGKLSEPGSVQSHQGLTYGGPGIG